MKQGFSRAKEGSWPAKIYQFNYEATKDAIANAMQNKPSAQDMIAKKDTAAHPFKGFDA